MPKSVGTHICLFLNLREEQETVKAHQVSQLLLGVSMNSGVINEGCNGKLVYSVTLFLVEVWRAEICFFVLNCLQQLCVILLQSLLSSILSLQNRLKMVTWATCKQHAYLKEAKWEARHLGSAALLTKHLLLSRKFLIFTYSQTFLNCGCSCNGKHVCFLCFCCT